MARLPVIACLVHAAVGVLATGAHGQARTTDTPEVRTAATVELAVRPDRGTLTLQFTADDSTPGAAGERVAVRADSVRRALMAIGIPRDSLLTASPWYWWPARLQVLTRPRCVPPVVPGRPCAQARDTIYAANAVIEYRPSVDTVYRAREVMEVRVGDPPMVGAVIDQALALRITDISGIRFSASDVQATQLAALREATVRARAQAEAIAAASGGRLGRVLSLGTQPDYPERYDYAAYQLGASVGGDASTVITAPSVPVRVTVYGRWQLLDR